MKQKKEIIIKGARLNNLKNISVKIPKNKIVVITGVSGSGKSTLAYDTIYAEAQRRYVESLSSYARQFLKNQSKPEFDEITGLSPAIAIEPKIGGNNPRSTVGTITEIYHYITLLYERLGQIVSPISGNEVIPSNFTNVKKYIYSLPINTRYIVSCPISKKQLPHLKATGYSRLIVDQKIMNINDTIKHKNIYLIIDRLINNQTNGVEFIMKEAYEKATEIGNGRCIIHDQNGKELKSFNTQLELDGLMFEQPNRNLFNFNNPYGACEDCNGHGELIDIDSEKVITDKQSSVFENAIHPFRSSGMQKWKEKLINQLKDIKFPVHKKYINLSTIEKKTLWEGNEKIHGLNSFFDYLKRKSYKIQYRVMLSKYRGLSKCKKCNGSRLNAQANNIFIQKKNISDIVDLSMLQLLKFMKNINSNQHEEKIITKIKEEIITRINSMINLGLDYLTLNRKSNSLSGGEHQRINIAKAIGSVLVGSIYVLDEPSIGLHSRDTLQLLNILRKLRDLGNSVIVVEHDKEIIKNSDYIIDIGPLAGINGGNIIYSGTPCNKKNNSLTLDYVNNLKKINKIIKSRVPTKFIKIQGITKNNLKNIDVAIPMKVFTAITGVSGSGKTTLIKDVFLPAIKRKLKDYSYKPAPCKSIELSLYEDIEDIDYINQNSIKKSSKSTPITYINAFDSIRSFYASQPKSILQNLTTKHFSFNVPGGRCEHCKGQGYIIIEMQFLADINIKCDLCKGNRYNKNILDIRFKENNISDILNLTIDEGYDFFHKNGQEQISKQMKPLLNVGLGYLKMGQAISNLSTGELQRLKLSSFLSKNNKKSILIFDEPTKGLHFHDIKVLIKSFEKLVEEGNTVILIEHNLDVIKNVDWVIDMGPEGGDKGGKIIFSGSPQELQKENSHTGRAIKKEING